MQVQHNSMSAEHMTAAQVLKGVSVGASTLAPETTKQLSDAVFLRLNSLQNTAYSNGYKDAKHEVAEYCMKTFGT